MSKSVIITGQTGAGKTRLADKLAKERGLKVLRCDDCLQLDRDKQGQAVHDMVKNEGVIIETRAKWGCLWQSGRTQQQN